MPRTGNASDVFVEGSREDLFGGLCPRERSWVGVPGGDPFADVVFQRDNAFMGFGHGESSLR